MSAQKTLTQLDGALSRFAPRRPSSGYQGHRVALAALSVLKLMEYATSADREGWRPLSKEVSEPGRFFIF
jgi:hypothetical protein